MKKTIKTLYGVILGMVLTAGCMLPQTASAAVTKGTCGDKASFSYDSNTKVLTVSGTGRIDSNKEMAATNPTTIVVEKGIEEIGPHTFEGYKTVTKITLPEGLTGLDYNALANMTGLKEITIPSTLEHSTSSGCELQGSGIEKITFAPGTKKVLANICYGCPSLTTVVLPDGLETIHAGAFEKCPKLAKVDLPSSVKELAARTFSGTAIKEIILPKSIHGLYGVAESPFEDTEDSKATLEKATFEEGALVVPQNMFLNTSSLKSVTLAKSMTAIYASAFKNCSALTSVTIYENVTDIRTDAFLGCPNVTIYGYSGTYAETYANANNIKFQSLGQLAPKKGEVFQDGLFNYKIINEAVDGTGKVAITKLNKNQKAVTVPATVKYNDYTYNVTEISTKAFYKKGKVKTVTIKSKKIAKMGKNAFKGINKKVTFKVPKSKKKAYKKMIKKAGAPKNYKVK